MLANAFSFSAFYASNSNYRYQAQPSSESPTDTAETVETPADDSPVTGGASAGEGMSNQGGTQNEQSGSHSFATQVSFSFSSMTMNSLGSKVFEFEVNSALQARVGGAENRAHQFGGRGHYELPGGPAVDSPLRDGGRHRGHPGGGYGLGYGLGHGLGRSLAHSLSATADRSEGIAGIKGAMDRIMNAVSAHLARFSDQSSIEVEGAAVSTAIIEGVQSTQEMLISLGAEGQSGAIDEAGEALLTEVAAQVSSGVGEPTTENPTTAADDTSTDVGASVSTSANSGYQFESVEESIGSRVKPVFYGGPVSSSFSSTTRGLDLMVETLDGDQVKVSFDQEFMKFRDRSEDALVSGRYASSDFQIQVDGNLDEGELEALNALLNEVSSLAESFFQGDVAEAFNFAVSMGMDESELASFSLSLQEQQVKSSIKAYDGVANLASNGVERGGAMNGQKAMGGLGDFVAQLRETLDSKAAAKFNNAQQIITEMLTRQVKEEEASQLAANNLVDGAEKRHTDGLRSVDSLLRHLMSGLSQSKELPRAA